MKLDIKVMEKELDGLVDDKYKEGMKMAVPTTWTVRGVRVPQLKEIAKGVAGKKKTEEDYREIMEFLEAAFDRKDRELAIIGINTLYQYRKYFNRNLTEKIKVWTGEVADWEICDNIAYMIIPELILKGVFTGEDLIFLRDHENIFARRAYIVSRVKMLRSGSGDTDEVLEEISFFNSDRDKYMIKAVSWALRSAISSEPEAVSAFIEKYRDEIHPLVVREVTNKLETGKKNR
ncbi:MAG: DNA alkylation repair protein [Actinobacteria bacterium]|nr:DNA alkylation repair protein [Actinomycetota bacterium]